jgi:hypothetical protein
MARYLIRQGVLNTWAVWDRVKRGPAVVDGRRLVGLTRKAAEAAYAHLIGADSGDALPISPQWRLIYTGVVVDCRDEQDAKSLARELFRKGYRVSAERTGGTLPVRRIDPTHLQQWLAE